MEWVLAYLAATAAFFVLDFVWLAKIAKFFYRDRLGSFLREKPNMTAAIIFYLVYVIGVVIFAVAPAVHDQSWQKALMLGALFGFFAYATYDMTNLATLKDWPLSVAIVDIAWGTALTGVSALFGYWAGSAFMSSIA